MTVVRNLSNIWQAAGKWLLLIVLVSIFSGTLSAFFLTALNQVTGYRERYPYLLYFLPLGGLLLGWLYHRVGRGTERGNSLVFDTIHSPGQVIPFRMAPLVLLGTLVSHLFGGSAGREGTARQMSAATADQLHRPLRLSAAERQVLLIMSLSAGFSSVFGTPLAGAIFGLEVLLIRKIPYWAVLPAFAAAYLGSWVTAGWGVAHTHYHIDFIPSLSLAGLGYSLLSGIAFAAAAVIFVQLTELVTHTFKKMPQVYLRPFFGGLVFVALVSILNTDKYLGLGIARILDAFHQSAAPQDFALKIFFTALTLGSGFKGGEVTPLFFIGATLGSALAVFLPLPLGLLAGMGFVSVFAGASKTPIACCFLALEIFGAPCLPYVVPACIVSYLLSGRYSIYNVAENKMPKHFLFGKFWKPFL